MIDDNNRLAILLFLDIGVYNYLMFMIFSDLMDRYLQRLSVRELNWHDMVARDWWM